MTWSSSFTRPLLILRFLSSHFGNLGEQQPGCIRDIRYAIREAETASKMRALHSTGAESPTQGSQNHGLDDTYVSARLFVLQNLIIMFMAKNVASGHCQTTTY